MSCADDNGGLKDHRELATLTSKDVKFLRSLIPCRSQGEKCSDPLFLTFTAKRLRK